MSNVDLNNRSSSAFVTFLHDNWREAATDHFSSAVGLIREWHATCSEVEPDEDEASYEGRAQWYASEVLELAFRWGSKKDLDVDGLENARKTIKHGGGFWFITLLAYQQGWRPKQSVMPPANDVCAFRFLSPRVPVPAPDPAEVTLWTGDAARSSLMRAQWRFDRLQEIALEANIKDEDNLRTLGEASKKIRDLIVSERGAEGEALLERTIELIHELEQQERLLRDVIIPPTYPI